MMIEFSNLQIKKIFKLNYVLLPPQGYLRS